MTLEILALLEDKDFELRKFAGIVRTDPALSEQLLRLAGSPLYGASQKFTDVQKAVVYLGLRTALTVGLGISLFRSMRHGAGSREEAWCWRRLVLNSAAVRELALCTKTAPPDLAFLAGLVQDFGLLCLVQQQRALYAPILAEHRTKPCPLVELERPAWDGDHAMVSEWMLGRWGLPEEVVRAVGRHHTAEAADSGGLTALVRVGEQFSEFLLGPAPATWKPLEASLHNFGAETSDDVAEICQLVVDRSASLADVLSVVFPAIEVRRAIENGMETPPTQDV